MTLNRNQATEFVRAIREEAKAVGLNLDEMIIDHLCYRTATDEEYEDLKEKVLSGVGTMLRGDLLAEAEIRGRKIATFRLQEPLVVEPHMIESLEIPAPKQGVKYTSGFEHVELVLRESFESYLNRCPKLTWDLSRSQDPLNAEIAVKLPSGAVKFHHLPLSCVIAIEERKDVAKVLADTKILERLKSWTPLLTGSLPLELGLESSDLDILLHAKSLDGADRTIESTISDVGPIQWSRGPCPQGEVLLGSFSSHGLKIALIVSETPVLEQDPHRHLLSSYKILVKFGPNVRRKVIHYKSEGLSTVEAFAKSAKLPGDPYTAMLDF